MKIERIPTSEAALHRSIRNLLQAKGIVYFESTFGRKTTMQPGTPDFLFTVKSGRWDGGCYPRFSVAWEAKIGSVKLSPAQKKMFLRMRTRPNAWQCEVVRSLDQAIKILEEFGV